MTTEGQLDWLLVEFVRQVPEVSHAIVVSADGLKLAASQSVGEALGDQLSAAVSGLVSLSRGTAHLLGTGAVTQTILEMSGGYLFATALSDGATLAVHAGPHCDIGMLGYEMTMLASRVGHALEPGVRVAHGGAWR